MNNTNNALETLVQRDKQIKKANDKLKASINELDAELETTTNALSNHASNTEIHTSKEELIKFIVDHLESLDLGITKEVVSVLPTENISDNTLYFVPNDKGSHNEYLYINDMWELVGSTETNFTDYYTKQESDTLLDGKADSVHNHVVKDITDFPTIPTKTSELSNDSNFVTSTELHDYATKNDLNSKQDALSEEQLSNIDSIPDKANKSDLSTVATSGSYKDLLDKPVLPEGADLSDYYNKGETDNLLNSKANTSDLAVVAKSGNYNDLNNTPTIPTKLSQLENDMGFGSGSGGVITSISWTNITDKPNFATVATSGSYNDLSNKPTIPNVYNKTLTIQKNGTNVATFTSNSNTDVTADITVPTKVSELSNDSGFITGISWDKVTNKPTLAKVATSGSYTDLSNTPTIPTKVSQLENDTGFVSGLTDVVDTKSNQTIGGTKKFTADIVRKYTSVDITSTPTSDMYAHLNFTDKNDKSVAYIQYAQKSNGVDYIGLRVRDKNSNTWGVQLNTNKEFVPLGNNSYSLGSSSYKWANVYATTFNGNLKGTIDSTTTATTQATTDNSTKIATTAWVRTYVNSVVGSGAVGASISAYYSNATTLTAESSSTIGTNLFPAVYSGYINIAPTVGTIYTGSQLFSSFTPTASGTKSSHVYQTTAYAKATFSGAFSASAKYLCTTANAVKFRAYVSQGTISDIGTASVVDNSSTKSIFIRVQ